MSVNLYVYVPFSLHAWRKDGSSIVNEYVRIRGKSDKKDEKELYYRRCRYTKRLNVEKEREE